MYYIGEVMKLLLYIVISSFLSLNLFAKNPSNKLHSIKQSEKKTIRMGIKQETAYLKKCDKGYKLYKYPEQMTSSFGVENHICLIEILSKH